MSIYAREKKRNPRIFRIDVDAQIDPCSTCIVRNEKSKEHCGDCRVHIKSLIKDNVDNSIVNSMITFV